MRLPVFFIFLTIVLDAMGIGLIMPVMPELILDVEGGSLAQAAVWGGVLATSFAVMQFLFSPVLGSLGDRYGRRPVLLVSLAFMALDYLIMALAGSIWLLLIGRVLGGLTAATHATAGAYMADISRPEDRGANFGLIGAGFGVGFVLGPLVGGMLGELGPRAPFYAAAGLAALNLVFGASVLRETVDDRIRRAFSWSRANPFGAIRSVTRLPGLGGLLAVYLLYSIAFYVYPAIWAFYGVERFGWSPQMIGLSLALYGISTAIVQGGLTRPVMQWLGDRRTVHVSLILETIAFLLLAVLSNGVLVLVLTPFMALGSILNPALQGIMSRRAADNQQGELQGVLTSLNALATIVSPLAMTSIFAAFTHEGTSIYLPGAPFLVSMMLMVVSLWVFARTRRAVA